MAIPLKYWARHKVFVLGTFSVSQLLWAATGLSAHQVKQVNKDIIFGEIAWLHANNYIEALPDGIIYKLVTDPKKRLELSETLVGILYPKQEYPQLPTSKYYEFSLLSLEEARAAAKYATDHEVREALDNAARFLEIAYDEEAAALLPTDNPIRLALEEVKKNIQKLR
jgi:hypothetical protein